MANSVPSPASSVYLQQEWKTESQNDELQEILAQFESSQYLRELNLFGALKDPEAKTASDSALTLPHSFFEEEFKADGGKRKAKDKDKDSSLKQQPQKKQKKKTPDGDDDQDVEDDLVKRRESHNATERRRREKINEKIDELRSLLPGGGKGVNKAAVLHQTAERSRQMQQLLARCLAEKRKAESQRTELVEEIYRLRSTLAHYQHMSFAQVHRNPGPVLPHVLTSRGPMGSSPGNVPLMPPRPADQSELMCGHI